MRSYIMENSYEGSSSLATISLVMGILSLLSFCNFPFAAFLFGGLGILFSCLSKGQKKRSKAAKAGLAISVSSLSIVTALIIAIFSVLIFTEQGQRFTKAYMSLITSEDTTLEDVQDFLEDYLYEQEGIPDFFPESTTDGDGKLI